MTPIEPKRTLTELLTRCPPKVRFCIVPLSLLLGVTVFSEPARAADKPETASWPPEDVALDARSGLLARSDILEVLVQKINDSMYLVVNQPEPGVIEAGRKGTKINEAERPDNADEWSKLLTTAGIDWVFSGAWDMVSFPAPWEERVQSNGLVFHHIFIWSDANETPQCSVEHAEFRCGRCDQPQDERWTIQFYWKPIDREGMSQQDRDACSVDSLR